MKKLIYIQIPKNGSKTIANLLKQKFKCISVYKNDRLTKYTEGTLQKYTVLFILYWGIPHFIENYPNIWNNSYKITVIRNPYNRFKSGWQFLPTLKNFNDNNILDNLPNYYGDRSNYINVINKNVTGNRKYHLPENLSLKEKVELNNYTHILDLQTHNIFKDGVLILDKLLRLEHLSEDIKIIERKFNIKFDKIPQINKNKSLEYIKLELTPKIINFINNHFDRDFQLLGYDKIIYDTES